MCGSEGKLFKVNIEGTQLNVCAACSRFGQVVERVPTPLTRKQKTAKKEALAQQEKEIVQLIVEDYGNLIKDKREKMGLKQKELAAKMSERESLIQKIETGRIEPSIELARKFERYLGLKLVEEHEEVSEKKAVGSGKALTIGDIIQIKTRG